LSFTVDDALDNGARLRSGESIESACALASAYGGYANAFTPRPKDTEANAVTAALRDEITPTAYADMVMQWVDYGARVVGGCCGVGPDHIAALRTRLG